MSFFGAPEHVQRGLIQRIKAFKKRYDKAYAADFDEQTVSNPLTRSAARFIARKLLEEVDDSTELTDKQKKKYTSLLEAMAGDTRFQ